MRTRSKGSRQLERFFLLTGGGCILIWVASVSGTAIYQDWSAWSFDHKLKGQPTTFKEYVAGRTRQVMADLGPPPKPPSLPLRHRAAPQSPREVRPQTAEVMKSGSLVGRLVIPRLHLSSMVREGAGETTLAVALGHIPGTALPGQLGNVGVAGHRDRLFRGLHDIQNNDLVSFQTLSGTYSYRVESINIVPPTDVGVLKPGLQPELTLVTCYPFYYVGPAPKRFIVRARQVLPETSAPAPVAPQVMTRNEKPKPKPAPSGAFTLVANHSRELAPGVLIGLKETDVADRRLSGWLWISRERRTIWLRDRTPVTIYGSADGKPRILVITNIARNSISGYLRASRAGQLPSG